MQDTNIPQNRVIIIGGDHHNGLGLARIFGLNGKNVTAIVISCKTHSWIATSRYIESHKIFKTEKDAFDYILKFFVNEPLKPILIPYSDGAALELDLRLQEFKNIFFVPSINEEQGRIASLMNKDAQYNWANERGIKMAKSITFDFSVDDIDKFVFSTYPCIIKPNNCAESVKKDIRICSDKNDLLKYLQQYKDKGYSKAIIQEYLNIDYEIDALGGINEDGISSIFPHTIIRRWPERRGTSSFSLVNVDEELIGYLKNVLEKLYQDGFVGLYDIEVFKVNKTFIMNEINFRNSGSGFRTISQNFSYAYQWFVNVVNQMPCHLEIPKKKTFSMTEYTDFRLVLTRKISLFKWIGDLRKSSDFSLYCKKDLKPLFAKIFSMVF